MSLRTFTSRFVRAYTPARVAPFTFTRAIATKRYTKEHEWISVEDDVGTIGITDYAQKSLGDVVFVEIPSPGQAIARKEQIGAVESVKAASDIYSPVSGDIIEANEALDQEPGLINSSPEADGWLAKVKLSDPSEIESLLDEDAYLAHCESSEDH
ncbi:glycine cleavage system H-protein subunit [Umbelopsis nana]